MVFALRQKVRAAKDFVASDFLRAALEISGIIVADGKDPTWTASFAGQERGWKKLSELSDLESRDLVDFDHLATLARSRKVMLSHELDSQNYLTDGYIVSVNEVPEAIDTELLSELVRTAGFAS
jgi:hypothetical protein